MTKFAPVVRIFVGAAAVAGLMAGTPPLAPPALAEQGPVSSLFAHLLPALGSTGVKAYLPTVFPDAGGAHLYATVSHVTPGRYWLMVDFTPDCHGADACHYGDVWGQRAQVKAAPAGVPVELGRHVVGYYVQGRCGASCAEGTVTWEVAGYVYGVGAKVARSGLIALAKSAVMAGAHPAASPAGAKGGAGVITVMSLGPLVFVASTPAQLRAWAGAPDRVWSSNGSMKWVGFGSPGSPGSPGWAQFDQGQVWGYRCGGANPQCVVIYAFVGGRLVGAATNSDAFWTAEGTHVGTTLTAARANEHGQGTWSGPHVQCPGVDLNVPRGVRFTLFAGSKSRDIQSIFLSESGHFLSACD